MKENRVFIALPAVAFQMVLANEFQELRTYACALPFGHYYQPRGAVCLSRKKWGNCQMRHQLAVHGSDKVFGAGRERQV